MVENDLAFTMGRPRSLEKTEKRTPTHGLSVGSAPDELFDD
jgi:hypothetical protein